MKIAILSDFHIGYERFVEDAYRQAEQALQKAASMADAMIIPGDIFDMRNPKPEVLAQGINLFRNLSKMGWTSRAVEYKGPKKIYASVPVVAIPGTHERKAINVEDPVELLNLAGLLVNVSDGRVILEKEGERVAIFALGGVSEERVRETLSQLDLIPMAGLVNVFMFHQSIYELLPFSDDFIKFEELPKGFDLYVCGHIHNRFETKVHGKPFLIPGSTVLTQLKDMEQEAKGFFIFDTKTKQYEFISIDSRSFFVEKFDATGKEPSELQSGVGEKIQKIIDASKEKPIIRIVINGVLKDGYRTADIDLLETVKKYQEVAIIEISKNNLEDKETRTQIEELRSGKFENMSIKDYGLGIFIEKLRASNYDLKVPPVELFELLSSGKSKEKALKDAMDRMFVSDN